MVKVKHRRTVDCVVGGYRVHKDGDGIGSILLGLYDGPELHFIGHCSGFPDHDRKELLVRFEEIRADGRPLRPPACLLLGGETTVTVRGRGLGGRCQELALSFAIRAGEGTDTCLLAAGTDGRDGPSPCLDRHVLAGD